jgi:hypothetical protein
MSNYWQRFLSQYRFRLITRHFSRPRAFFETRFGRRGSNRGGRAVRRCRIALDHLHHAGREIRDAG